MGPDSNKRTITERLHTATSCPYRLDGPRLILLSCFCLPLEPLLPLQLAFSKLHGFRFLELFLNHLYTNMLLPFSFVHNSHLLMSSTAPPTSTSRVAHSRLGGLDRIYRGLGLERGVGSHCGRNRGHRYCSRWFLGQDGTSGHWLNSSSGSCGR